MSEHVRGAVDELDVRSAAPHPAGEPLVTSIRCYTDPRYRRHRQLMLNQFAEPRTPVVAERILKACLILAPAEEDLAPLGKLAAVAVPAGQKRQPPNDFKLVKALWEYRSGNFAKSLDWLKKLDLQGAETARPLQAQGDLVLAMTQYRLGQKEAASAALAEGIRLAEVNVSKPKNRDFGLGWGDWIIAQALIREARGLVEGQTANGGH